MQFESTEILWFEQHVLSLPQLSELSGLPAMVLEELLDCGAIAPIDPAGSEPKFGAAALRAARTAGRLRSDFELDAPALSVALRLLERVEDLEAQLRALQARLPQRLP